MKFKFSGTIVLAGLLVTAGCGGGSETSFVLPQSSALRLEQVTAALSSPVFVTAAPGDTSRLFIVEQGGRIRIFDRTAGVLQLTPFLDISALILSGGERGLLGLAFDPFFVVNRRFYVYYIDTAGGIVIARYLRDSVNVNLADAASGIPLVNVPHPSFANHNGGMLAFGPEGCLYAGTGDGGGSGDPGNNAQTLSSLLGKLLRLDPASGGACASVTTNPFPASPLVWSLGLRNPWRFSFDRLTGDLYMADVGQNAREEIDVSPAPQAGRGLNYGWRIMEGFECFNPAVGCNTAGLTLPVLDYAHVDGACSVTGGYVYRGTSVPALRGTYFYADFCAGFVRSFRFAGGVVTEQTEWPLLTPPGGAIGSFGEDAGGELYIVSLNGGLWRIVPN